MGTKIEPHARNPGLIYKITESHLSDLLKVELFEKNKRVGFTHVLKNNTGTKRISEVAAKEQLMIDYLSRSCLNEWS